MENRLGGRFEEGKGGCIKGERMWRWVVGGIAALGRMEQKGKVMAV